jgi:hypothetical protein
MKQAIKAIVLALFIAACGAEGDDLFSDNPDAGIDVPDSMQHEIGQTAEAWQTRKHASSGRIWSVRNNDVRACTATESSTCYFFGKAAYPDDNVVEKYFIKDVNNEWGTSTENAIETRINNTSALLSTYAGNVTWSFQRVSTEAAADINIVPINAGPTFGLSKFKYRSVSFPSTACTSLIEGGAEYPGTYKVCTKATVGLDPGGLSFYLNQIGWGSFAQSNAMQELIDSMILGLIGVGQQSSTTTSATRESFSTSSAVLLNSEESCRVANLGGPGAEVLGTFSISSTTCP